MKLIKLIIDPFQCYAKLFLSYNEAIDELRIMEKIQFAQIDVLFGGNTRALHDLNYKRNIQLNDGRVLVGAWCFDVEKIDNNKYIAKYYFSKVSNKEDFR